MSGWRSAIAGEGILMSNWRPVISVVTMALALLAGRGSASGNPVKHAPEPHSVVLTWTASASAKVIGYNVYRSTPRSGVGRAKRPLKWQKITPNAIHGATYTDTTVRSKRTYYYAVTAVGSKGHESIFSRLVQADVP